MKKGTRIFSFVFFVLTLTVYFLTFTFQGQVFAGAWTQKEGGMYNNFSFNYYSATQEFDSNGDKFNKPNGGIFENINLSYYAEYGLKDNLTVFGSTSYKHLRNFASDGSSGLETKEAGVGDIDVGLRYRLYKGESTVISISGLVKIPEAYDENRLLPLGNGQYDFETRLLIGKSLYPLPMYFGLEFGYRFRFEEPSDEYKLLAELGYSVTDKFYLRTKVDATLSVKNGDKITTGSTVLPLNYDLVKLNLTAGYRLSKNLGVEFTFTPDIMGKNIIAGRNSQLALYYFF